MEAKDAENDRQQREILTLRVRTCDYNKVTSLQFLCIEPKR